MVIDLTQTDEPLGPGVNIDYDLPLDPKEEAARECMGLEGWDECISLHGTLSYGWPKLG